MTRHLSQWYHPVWRRYPFPRRDHFWTHPHSTPHWKAWVCPTPISYHGSNPLHNNHFTWIILPIFLRLIHIGIIKPLSGNRIRLIIIDNSSSMKLILIPLPFICELLCFIVQFAETTHHVVFPSALVVASVSVVESAMAITLAVQHVTDVFASVLVDLLHIVAFWF